MTYKRRRTSVNATLSLLNESTKHKIIWAVNEDRDQLAHPRSLIRVFHASAKKLRVSCHRNREAHIQPRGSLPVDLKGVTLTLHGTRCVHTSMNRRRMKFISYIYTFLYIIFVHYLWNLYSNFANKRWRKVIIRCVWLLHSTAVTMIWRQSKVTSANQLLHLSLTSLMRNDAWTTVVHGCMNLVVQISSSKEIIGECKYLFMYNRGNQFY